MYGINSTLCVELEPSSKGGLITRIGGKVAFPSREWTKPKPTQGRVWVRIDGENAKKSVWFLGYLAPAASIEHSLAAFQQIAQGWSNFAGKRDYTAEDNDAEVSTAMRELCAKVDPQCLGQLRQLIYENQHLGHCAPEGPGMTRFPFQMEPMYRSVGEAILSWM
jgi:hypothetical protein